MGTVFIAKTSQQQIPEIPINNREVVQPANHYTCPAGKKAIFKGYVICTGLGASTSAFLRDPSDSFNIQEWTTSTTTEPFSSVVGIGIKVPTTLELTASQSIRTTQNLGATNAEFEVIGTILELPA